jgi:hypothetical protein
LVTLPTAVHAVVDAHDTPNRRLLAAPVMVGVRWIDQRVPFQCSANATPAPARLVKYPTAVQVVPDAHDTLDRTP